MSMQISRVNNAVRSLCSGPSSATTCNVQRHLVTGLSTQLHRQRHQRRQSSSKTSISPAVPPTASPQHDTTGEAPTKTSSSRLNRRRPKNASAVTLKDKDDIPAGLPVVPPTNNLNEHDVSLSSFYSQHRPISVTTSTPPETSYIAFKKLFQKRSKSKTADTIDTLSHTVQSYEDGVKVLEANGVRLEIRESAVDPHRQADRATLQQEFRPVTLEEYVARFRPYTPPPPPLPLQPTERRAKRKSASKGRETEVTRTENSPRQTSYKTTILVTESVHANGQKTYTASTSPLEEVPNPTPGRSLKSMTKDQVQIQQPFLERMKIRQQRLHEFRRERSGGRPGKMLLISVKRQRKLKMKKHKYKKLMKRTRTLRRKLDRN